MNMGEIDVNDEFSQRRAWKWRVASRLTNGFRTFILFEAAALAGVFHGFVGLRLIWSWGMQQLR